MAAPLSRTPEPELMLDVEQVRAYSEADFATAHDAFVAHARAAIGELVGPVADLGCGPADVTVRLARANPRATFVGVDGSPAMLELGRERVAAAGLADRIRLELVLLPDPAAVGTGYAAVVSNSLLHHLDDPAVLWRAIRAAGRPGAPFAVGDLVRPGTRAALDGLVERNAAGEPPVLVHDFAASLGAAYTADEIAAQLAATDLVDVAVDVVTDRHVLATGRVPG
jgi:SAM-dependent methyltransferase